MKKLFLAFFVSCFCLVGIAQQDLSSIAGYEFGFYDDFGYPGKMARTQVTTEKKIKTQTYTRYKEDREEFRMVEEFDISGKLVSQTNFNTKGQYYQKHYDRSTPGVVVLHEKGLKYSTTTYYYYDAEGRFLEESGYNSEGVYEAHKNTYDPAGKILSQSLYREDSINPWKRLEYSYYDTGTKKTINYYHENELEYTWKFDCKEEGELVLAKENEADSSFICISKDIDSSGYEITWRHELNENGEGQKIRTVKKDGVLISITTYWVNGLMLHEKLFFGDGGYVWYYIDKKGRIDVFTETIYNAEGQLVYSDLIDGPKTTSYNENGQTVYSWKKGKIVSVEETVSAGDVYITTKSKRDKVKSVTETAFTYH